MGHLRLGRLPKHRNWQRVVSLLDLDTVDVPAVARETAKAAENHLRQLGRDPSVTYCFWLLVRIASASRQGDMSQQLQALGVSVGPADALLTLISRVSDQARRTNRTNSQSDALAELAALSLKHALAETVGVQGASLFGSSMEDFSRACRAYSTQRQFGVLAKTFFGDFLGRTLRYFLDRELANHIGNSHGIRDIGDSRQFIDSIDLFSRQSARIMETFAGSWFSKHEWQSSGNISQDDAARFVAIAMRKLRMELASERERS